MELFLLVASKAFVMLVSVIFCNSRKMAIFLKPLHKSIHIILVVLLIGNYIIK